MALIRRDPMSEFDHMFQRINRMFGPMWPLTRLGSEERETLAFPDWSPAVDISETDDAYYIRADLPDVKKQDVRVTLEDGTLTLRGERKQEEERKGERYHRVERSYGSFLRSFSLPDAVDEAKVDAKFNDGILAIHVPKTHKAEPRGREVSIQ